MDTATQRRTFYSTSANLVIAIGGEVRWVDNHRQKIGEKHAIFTPQGGPSPTAANSPKEFGVLHTDDLEIIAALEERIKQLGARSDVFEPSEYKERSMSAEELLADTKQEMRALQTRNSLLEKLVNEKKVPAGNHRD